MPMPDPDALDPTSTRDDLERELVADIQIAKLDRDLVADFQIAKNDFGAHPRWCAWWRDDIRFRVSATAVAGRDLS